MVELHQPSQQKPGMEMGLYQEKHCQCEIKWTQKVEWKEGSLSEFLDSIGSDHSVIGLLNTYCSSKKIKNDFQGNSEINRAATPTRGSVDRVVFSSLVSKGGPQLRFPVGQDDLVQCLRSQAELAESCEGRALAEL